MTVHIVAYPHERPYRLIGRAEHVYHPCQVLASSHSRRWQLPNHPYVPIRTYCLKRMTLAYTSISTSGLWLVHSTSQMIFGLMNAPETLQRTLERFLSSFQWKSYLVFIDDEILFRKSYKKHLTQVDTTPKVLQDAGVSLKTKNATSSRTLWNSLCRKRSRIGHLESYGRGNSITLVIWFVREHYSLTRSTS